MSPNGTQNPNTISYIQSHHYYTRFIRSVLFNDCLSLVVDFRYTNMRMMEDKVICKLPFHELDVMIVRKSILQLIR